MPHKLCRCYTWKKWQNFPSPKEQLCLHPAVCHVTTKVSSRLLRIFSNPLLSGFSLTSRSSGCFLFGVSFQMLLLNHFCPCHAASFAWTSPLFPSAFPLLPPSPPQSKLRFWNLLGMTLIGSSFLQLCAFLKTTYYTPRSSRAWRRVLFTLLGQILSWTKLHLVPMPAKESCWYLSGVPAGSGLERFCAVFKQKRDTLETQRENWCQYNMPEYLMQSWVAYQLFPTC